MLKYETRLFKRRIRAQGRNPDTPDGSKNTLGIVGIPLKNWRLVINQAPVVLVAEFVIVAKSVFKSPIFRGRFFF